MSEAENLRDSELQRGILEMRLDEARMEVAVLKAQLCRMAMTVYGITREEAEVMVYGRIVSGSGIAVWEAAPPHGDDWQHEPVIHASEDGEL